jgi:hypothetical protein
MTVTDADLEGLRSVHNRGAGRSPLPSDFDERIGAVVDGYAAADSTEQADIRQRLTAEHALTLRAFAERSASLARQTNSVAPLRTGLLALAMAHDVSDPRETLIQLALQQHAAHKLGTDIDTVGRSVSDAFSPAFSTRLREFLDRPNNADLLDDMGYREVSPRPGALVYERTW